MGVDTDRRIDSVQEGRGESFYYVHYDLHNIVNLGRVGKCVPKVID